MRVTPLYYLSFYECDDIIEVGVLSTIMGLLPNDEVGFTDILRVELYRKTHPVVLPIPRAIHF
jgi:hypothetical protein